MENGEWRLFHGKNIKQYVVKKNQFYKTIIGLSIILLLVTLIMIATGNIEKAGPFFIGFFVFLALGFRGFKSLRSYSYTVTIFAAVTTALYYPQYFTEVEGFKFSTLITPLIQLIMFGMGTSMGIKDFIGVVKTPGGVLIGVTSHFIIMPLVGFLLASVSGFTPEIAAGIILIGCSPNGLASNVISYLAKANLALSITITAVSTMLAPLVTPLLMKLLAGAFIEINVLDMMWDIGKMVIIPVGAGILFNKLLHGRARWLDAAMPILSMFGIAFIIVIITASGRDSLLKIGPWLMLLVLIHNLSGYTLGYWTGRLFRMSERDCRTIAIEVGMQNGGLASGLAKEMGKMATVGLAPAIFSSIMNITGSLLASYWHRKPVNDKQVPEEMPEPGLVKT
jgi:BASS family bile acid:Na+ symporter